MISKEYMLAFIYSMELCGERCEFLCSDIENYFKKADPVVTSCAIVAAIKQV
jgi:hypothetical protein